MKRNKVFHPEMNEDLYKRIYSHLKQLKIIQKRNDINILTPYDLYNSSQRYSGIKYIWKI